jgi:hypothetical protein
MLKLAYKVVVTLYCRVGTGTTKTQAMAFLNLFSRHVPVVRRAVTICTRQSMSLSSFFSVHDDLLTQFTDDY